MVILCETQIKKYGKTVKILIMDQLEFKMLQTKFYVMKGLKNNMNESDYDVVFMITAYLFLVVIPIIIIKKIFKISIIIK